MSTVWLADLLARVAALRREVAKRIVGQEEAVEEVLLAILAGGHALLVGVPGLAKTLMVRSVADGMRLAFRRIQFTPDLVPSDITGTEVMEEDSATRHRAFRFVPGPVFANIVLADEINRAPPRTQAALLEAMQERSVTAAGETRALPAPFFVLATQNPIEQEGTYPLPEAQLDRFLFQVRVHYPGRQDEIGILRATTSAIADAMNPVMDGPTTLALQGFVRDLPAADAILGYAADLVRATRPDGDDAPPIVREFVRWGAGPRAGQALVLGAKAFALLRGGLAVMPSDIRRVVHPVLRHRILTNFAAEAEGVTVDRVIDAVLEAVPPPHSGIGA
ncbi:MAG: MoxR family ATPase [Gemmatimonadaceae bacterium]|nr:MoxR family ATPase [Gemmatimonadaceae bacterium]MCW5825786.1 MoxR family ATPase [Gemmatimonadaceae bacterium]